MPFRGNFLVYYKTSPYFLSDKRRKAHPNNREIMVMVKVLTRLGYSVDLVDRAAKWDQIKRLLSKSYDGYILNGAGNSAPLSGKIAARINTRKTVLYAAGSEKKWSFEVTLERHISFEERTGCSCVHRRLVGGFAEGYLGKLDALLYLGEIKYERWSHVTPAPIFEVQSSVDFVPLAGPEEAEERNPSRFVYIGGNGHIAKGLDLVLEAFDGLEGIRLDVFANLEETDFWDCYSNLIARNPNIYIHGFVSTDSEKFLDITRKALYSVFPSASEANATSVLTGMRRGLIPVVTLGVAPADVEDFGHIISDVSVKGIRALVRGLQKEEKVDWQLRSARSASAGARFSIENYESRFLQAIEAVMG